MIVLSLLFTNPAAAPVPVFVTVSVCGPATNVAVTVCAPFIVTTQVPVPEHTPPDQPLNVEPPVAAAVNVTAWP